MRVSSTSKNGDSIDETDGKMLTVQSDSDLSSVFGLEFLSVYFHCAPVSNQNILAHNPRLSTTIAYSALRPITRMAGSEETSAISQYRATPRLVERDPVLDLRPKSFKHHPSIPSEIGHKLLFVEQSTISPVQLIWKIPMEERDHGRYPGRDQIIHEVDVESQSLFVDWILASPERDDPRPSISTHYSSNSHHTQSTEKSLLPRQRKPIRLRPARLQQLDVFRRSMVRVACHISGTAVRNLSRDLAEGVPDRRTSSVSLWRTFDLVTKSHNQPLTRVRTPFPR